MIIRILLICLLGTFFHFTYQLSNQNKIVGYFSSVNESTWEHIKIAITPTLLTLIVDYFYVGENPNFFIASFICLFCIVFLIPLFFYVYKAIFKKIYLIVDILIFYIAIIVSQVVYRYLLTAVSLPEFYKLFSIIGIFFIIIAYFRFTYNPPHNFLFRDPINGGYGIKAFHSKKKKRLK